MARLLSACRSTLCFMLRETERSSATVDSGCATTLSMAQNIQVTLPDGSKKEVPSGTTPSLISPAPSAPGWRTPRWWRKSSRQPSAVSNQRLRQMPTGQQAGGSGKNSRQHARACRQKTAGSLSTWSKPLEEKRRPAPAYGSRPRRAVCLSPLFCRICWQLPCSSFFLKTKLGHGPPTDTGFFYHSLRPTPFTPEDLEKIEKRMGEVAARDEKFEREFIRAMKGLRASALKATS